MVCPLYTPVAHVTPTRAGHGNAGLWYDKFCNKWPASQWSLKGGGQGSNPKLSWIDTLTDHVHGVPDQVEEYANRLIRLSIQQGGLSLVFHAESRFVTGLGRSHPVENGFAWHHTLGTPYLPGSSIKGMVRAWAEKQADPTPDSSIIKRVFGAPGQAGAISFLDALPIAPVTVEADVLTPHTAAWSPSNPPGDWCSPGPVPFLVTAAGLRLLFTVVPCGKAAAGDLDLVETWLKDALTWAGAGAKTAVGYGRMGLDQPKTDDLWQAEQQRQQRKQEALHEQKRLASLGPLDLELEKLSAAEPATSPPPPPYRAWIKAVESGRWRDQPATALQVLDRIETAMRQSGDWKEISQKKNQNKPDRRFKLTNHVKELRASTQSG